MVRTLVLAAVLVAITACGATTEATTADNKTTPTPTAHEPTPSTAAPDPAPVPADLQRAARFFLAFARGDRDYPLADAPIELYLGGQRTGSLPSSVLGDRQGWQTCPEGGHFAGRVCPVSALEVVRQHPGAVVAAAAPPANTCVSSAQTLAAATVSLTPKGVTSCLDYWVVQLVVNDVGQGDRRQPGPVRALRRAGPRRKDPCPTTSDGVGYA